ncbi:hypothetical protein GCM10028818_52520 [Spirosoma horti]
MSRQNVLPYSENGNSIIDQDGGMFGPAGDIHIDLADMIRYWQTQIEEKDVAFGNDAITYHTFWVQCERKATLSV